MMERQRHAKDIAHPMYEITDNALSALDGYNTLRYPASYIHNDITYWFVILNAYKNSKTCEVSSSTSN